MIYRGLTTHNTEHSQTFSNPCIIKCTKMPYDFPTNKTKINYSTNLPQYLLHKEKNHFSQNKRISLYKNTTLLQQLWICLQLWGGQKQPIIIMFIFWRIKNAKDSLSLNTRRKESGNQLLFLAPPWLSLPALQLRSSLEENVRVGSLCEGICEGRGGEETRAD